jgi:hypothetical protein
MCSEISRNLRYERGEREEREELKKREDGGTVLRNFLKFSDDGCFYSVGQEFQGRNET